MQTPEFIFEIESEKSPREAVVAVMRATHAAGWVVVGDYELSGLVAEKGGQLEVKSVDICQPELARPFVGSQPLTALCMPCSVLIYSDHSKTRLAVMRPSMVLPHLFEETATVARDVATRIDRELEQILNAAR